MKKWIAVLIILLTSVSITGFSYIDNLILDRVIAGLVAVSTFIVGLLYKFGILYTRRDGSDTFKGVFIMLLIISLVMYLGIRKFQEWVLAWPQFVKIIVPLVMGLMIISIILLAIYDHSKKCDNYD